jgi:hypothetical protein
LSTYGGGVSKNELEIRLRTLESRIRQLLVGRDNAPVSASFVTRVVNAIGDQLAWDDITSKPAAFPPSSHTHGEGQIVGLDKYTQAEVNTLLSALTLVGLADVSDAPFENGQTVIFNGGVFVPGAARRPGITYRTVPAHERVRVVEGEQYLVFQELTVEGEFILDGGELVIL